MCIDAKSKPLTKQCDADQSKRIEEALEKVVAEVYEVEIPAKAPAKAKAVAAVAA